MADRVGGGFRMLWPLPDLVRRAAAVAHSRRESLVENGGELRSLLSQQQMYQAISVDGEQLALRALTASGRLHDAFTLIKEKEWSQAPHRAAREETGEMWNSNSVIAWTLARGGIDAASIQ